jgi:uncharacterized protein (DUF1697 family)
LLETQALQAQAIDARYDAVLREQLGERARVALRDGCWNVEVVREAPADAVLACVARRRGLGCRRVPAAPDR